MEAPIAWIANLRSNEFRYRVTVSSKQVCRRSIVGGGVLGGGSTVVGATVGGSCTSPLSPNIMPIIMDGMLTSIIILVLPIFFLLIDLRCSCDEVVPRSLVVVGVLLPVAAALTGTSSSIIISRLKSRDLMTSYRKVHLSNIVVKKIEEPEEKANSKRHYRAMHDNK
jgi:hypothetical protein